MSVQRVSMQVTGVGGGRVLLTGRGATKRAASPRDISGRQAKTCPKCGVFQPISAFKRNRSMPDGHSGYCRACDLVEVRRWKAANPDYVAAYNAARRKPQLTKVCYCGTVFVTAYPNFKYCQRHQNIKPLAQRRRIAAGRRRRIGTGHTRITSEVIFDRDNGICWICGGDVPRNAAKPDPRTPSVDHVVHASRGGTDTLDNVKLAHLGCNIRRGNRP